jgi:hypothetical protein
MGEVLEREALHPFDFVFTFLEYEFAESFWKHQLADSAS